MAVFLSVFLVCFSHCTCRRANEKTDEKGQMGVFFLSVFPSLPVERQMRKADKKDK